MEPEMTGSDQRVCDSLIVLAGRQGRRTLSASESRLVIENLELVAREVTKWTRMTNRAGQLILIDSVLIEEVERLLASEERG
jgi:hypothetical protein